MATYHCSVKVGKSGTGSAHADYIRRDGKYASKDKGDLEHTESGNLPSWADSSRDFWKAADEHERVNGSVYRELEIALPRELTPAQRLDMVRDFIAQEIGDDKTYTFAIHNPRAMIDGGEQPHAHIMYSERLQDGIERNRESHFKRYNSKDPSKGGCKKDNPSKTPTERKSDLVALRERFAELQNQHLERAGQGARVTHLSLAAQGNEREPEPHLGPKVAQAVAHQVKALRQEIKNNPQHWRDVDLVKQEETRALIASLYETKAILEGRAAPAVQVPKPQPKPPAAAPQTKPVQRAYSDAEALAAYDEYNNKLTQKKDNIAKQIKQIEMAIPKEKWQQEQLNFEMRVLQKQGRDLGKEPWIVGRDAWRQKMSAKAKEFVDIERQHKASQEREKAHQAELDRLNTKAIDSKGLMNEVLKEIGRDDKAGIGLLQRGQELAKEREHQQEKAKQEAIKEQERLRELARSQEPEPEPKRPSRGFNLGM